jgi:hypothetical protein
MFSILIGLSIESFPLWFLLISAPSRLRFTSRQTTPKASASKAVESTKKDQPKGKTQGDKSPKPATAPATVPSPKPKASAPTTTPSKETKKPSTPAKAEQATPAAAKPNAEKRKARDDDDDTTAAAVVKTPAKSPASKQAAKTPQTQTPPAKVADKKATPSDKKATPVEKKAAPTKRKTRDEEDEQTEKDVAPKAAAAKGKKTTQEPKVPEKFDPKRAKKMDEEDEKEEEVRGVVRKSCESMCCRFAFSFSFVTPSLTLLGAPKAGQGDGRRGRPGRAGKRW